MYHAPTSSFLPPLSKVFATPLSVTGVARECTVCQEPFAVDKENTTRHICPLCTICIQARITSGHWTQAQAQKYFVEERGQYCFDDEIPPLSCGVCKSLPHGLRCRQRFDATKH